MGFPGPMEVSAVNASAVGGLSSFPAPSPVTSVRGHPALRCVGSPCLQSKRFAECPPGTLDSSQVSPSRPLASERAPPFSQQALPFLSCLPSIWGARAVSLSSLCPVICLLFFTVASLEQKNSLEQATLLTANCFSHTSVRCDPRL